MPYPYAPVLLSVPHLQQPRDGDCLPVCAYMVLAYIYLNDPELPDAPIPVTQGDFDLAWLAQDERYAVLLP